MNEFELSAEYHTLTPPNDSENDHFLSYTSGFISMNQNGEVSFFDYDGVPQNIDLNDISDDD